MTSDALHWISMVSSILGLWALIGIITFLILCWRRISYVYRLRDARKKVRGQIQRIQDEIQSLIDTHPNIDGVICQILHTSIQDREERLNILSRVEDSLWISFFALFRADPCLRLLEGLEQDLRQKVQRMTEARETRLVILGAYTPLDARQHAILPTDDISSSREEGNNIRTCQADAISQRAESASHDRFGGDITRIEIRSAGTRISNLRRRRVLDPPVSRDLSPRYKYDSLPTADREYFRQVVKKLSDAPYLVSPHSLEPTVGSLDGRLLIGSCRLTGPGAAAARESVYAVLVDRPSEGPYICWICGETRADRRLVRALVHVRGHFNHRPYHCSETHFDQHTESTSPLPSESSCGQSFTSAEALKDHQTKMKHYRHTCATCGKFYINFANLKRHMRKEHSS